MTSPASLRLARGLLLAYALPSLAIALPTIPLYIYLPALYGNELGMAATGLALLLARGFDTLTDPVVGTLCDRYAPGGRTRKPWIAAGAALAGLGLVMVLNPPPAPGFSYLLGWSLPLFAGWTLIAVPYSAWGAELSEGYDERTRITSWRESFGLAGILAAGIMMAALARGGIGEAEAVGHLAWIAVGFGLLLFPLLLWSVPERALRRARSGPSDRLGLRASLLALCRNRLFLRLLSAWFLNGLANGIPAVLFLIYLEHGLGMGAGLRPVFILAYFLAAVAAMPAWLSLSRAIGKHRAWCWAMIAACLAFAAVPAIPEGGFAAFAIVTLITGAALGADLALPPAMQADVLDYGELRNRQALAGTQFALWSMSTKLALAAAAGVALPTLAASGFDPGTGNVAPRWPLVAMYALLPVAIKAAAIAVVWRFPLTAGRQAAIRRRLDRRVAARDASA